MMATLHSHHVVGIPQMPLQVPFLCGLERTSFMKAAELALSRNIVDLHVGLQLLALLEGFSTCRTGVLVRADLCSSLFSMHVGQVPAERVALDRSVVAQVAVVQLLAGFPQHVDAKLALAGEVALAGGALQAGVWEVQVHVLHQVGAGLEAAAALGAYVGAELVLSFIHNGTFRYKESE